MVKVQGTRSNPTTPSLGHGHGIGGRAALGTVYRFRDRFMMPCDEKKNSSRSLKINVYGRAIPCLVKFWLSIAINCQAKC